MRVLVAVDGSPCSDAAVNEITSRPWPVGTEIRIITAFQAPLAPTPEAWAIPVEYFDSLDRAARQQAESIKDNAIIKLAGALDRSIKLTAKVLPGPARSVILEEADQWRPDLIVVGSHGYGAWHRFLLGSVSQAVVSHAKCSVEVVRTPDHRPETKAA